MSRYTFEFVCSKEWDDLKDTGAPDHRFCGHCKKDVHRVTDPTAIDALVAAKKCILADDDVLREARMVLPAVPHVSTHRLIVVRSGPGEDVPAGTFAFAPNGQDADVPGLRFVEEVTIGSGSAATVSLGLAEAEGELLARIFEWNDAFYIDALDGNPVRILRGTRSIEVEKPTRLLFGESVVLGPLGGPVLGLNFVLATQDFGPLEFKDVSVMVAHDIARERSLLEARRTVFKLTATGEEKRGIRMYEERLLARERELGLVRRTGGIPRPVMVTSGGSEQSTEQAVPHARIRPLCVEHLSPPHEGEIVFLTRGRSTVGRDPRSDLSFDKKTFPTVSRKHATVTWDGAEYWLEDQPSRHGTWVNNQQLEERHALQDGDVVQLGGGSGPKFRVGLGDWVTH